ncbi:MAG: ammonium transporter [Victivallales bacterium]|nr:ammonium transporter [Victivallales bacterium]
MFNISLKILLVTGIVLVSGAASAAEAPVKVSPEMFTVNNLWMLIATALVFIMHLGFATLEAGLTRAKNTVNILYKNVLIVAIGLLTYAIVGFGLMYHADGWMLGKVFGFAGFGLTAPEGDAGLIAYSQGAYTYWTDFIFQGMFAATAATIVSGAVAERVKLDSFLIFSTFYVAVIYPIAGSWGWGKGWLDQLHFHDFAGSTFVHSVGGWGALVAVILLGPRLGKYVNGKSKPIWGHNMPLATIGALLLWFGWFGFNGGSVLSADPGAVSYVFVTTSLAAAAGIVAASTVSWRFQKHPDLSMVLNGCLAGLVAVTAGADVLSVSSAIIVGIIAGIIVVFSVFFFDSIKLDDPVGALSVHLVCGIWGTLAVGIFCKDYSFLAQLTGVAAVGAFCVLGAFAIFLPVKYTLGLRMSADDELRGLDICEHGMEAYHGFQIFNNQ